MDPFPEPIPDGCCDFGKSEGNPSHLQWFTNWTCGRNCRDIWIPREIPLHSSSEFSPHFYVEAKGGGRQTIFDGLRASSLDVGFFFFVEFLL